MPRKPGHTKKTTMISVSLPAELVKAVDRMAESENRNRSNFIANALCRLARDFARSEGRGSGPGSGCA